MAAAGGVSVHGLCREGEVRFIDAGTGLARHLKKQILLLALYVETGLFKIEI